ncbi:MarR family winged helix-turn-helix transcriptional regulator [Mycobacterium sp. SMC-8]|uniref:MarR family winged helix-turn-helix transcriptional regulator n=1 Tax=Mycobacterium sp. SMC-8 TaxID=2857060 RepID=UPI0021B22E7C|nr:MarR family winged helix-turn-helix transcriptional regulator [Mycobacterium sp. SMC-8]
MDGDALYDYQAKSFQRYVIGFGEWMTRTSLARLQRSGHHNLRPAHARLMVFLAWEGSRVSDLAADLGVTKNAVGQLVTELESFGYVERAPDPVDGRAKIVRYTERGRGVLRDNLAISVALDAEVEHIIGAERFEWLREALADIFASLPPADAAGDET